MVKLLFIYLPYQTNQNQSKMSAVVVLIVFAVLVIVGRELITWYFKINKIEEVLREILEEIKEKRVNNKQES